MASNKTITALTAKLGSATKVFAIHPTTQIVYPIYNAPQVLDTKGNDITPAAFSFIKAGEIMGPYADTYVARDKSQYNLQLDIERGVSNP